MKLLRGLSWNLTCFLVSASAVHAASVHLDGCYVYETAQQFDPFQESEVYTLDPETGNSTIHQNSKGIFFVRGKGLTSTFLKSGSISNFNRQVRTVELPEMGYDSPIAVIVAENEAFLIHQETGVILHRLKSSHAIHGFEVFEYKNPSTNRTSVRAVVATDDELRLVDFADGETLITKKFSGVIDSIKVNNRIESKDVVRHSNGKDYTVTLNRRVRMIEVRSRHDQLSEELVIGDNNSFRAYDSTGGHDPFGYQDVDVNTLYHEGVRNNKLPSGNSFETSKDGGVYFYSPSLRAVKEIRLRRGGRDYGSLRVNPRLPGWRIHGVVAVRKLGNGNISALVTGEKIVLVNELNGETIVELDAPIVSTATSIKMESIVGAARSENGRYLYIASETQIIGYDLESDLTKPVSTRELDRPIKGFSNGNYDDYEMMFVDFGREMRIFYGNQGSLRDDKW